MASKGQDNSFFMRLSQLLTFLLFAFSLQSDQRAIYIHTFKVNDTFQRKQHLQARHKHQARCTSTLVILTNPRVFWWYIIILFLFLFFGRTLVGISPEASSLSGRSVAPLR